MQARRRLFYFTMQLKQTPPRAHTTKAGMPNRCCPQFKLAICYTATLPLSKVEP